jgi:hypothetical protein
MRSCAPSKGRTHRQGESAFTRRRDASRMGRSRNGSPLWLRTGAARNRATQRRLAGVDSSCAGRAHDLPERGFAIRTTGIFRYGHRSISASSAGGGRRSGSGRQATGDLRHRVPGGTQARRGAEFPRAVRAGHTGGSLLLPLLGNPGARRHLRHVSQAQGPPRSSSLARDPAGHPSRQAADRDAAPDGRRGGPLCATPPAGHIRWTSTEGGGSSTGAVLRPPRRLRYRPSPCADASRHGGSARERAPARCRGPCSRSWSAASAPGAST